MISVCRWVEWGIRGGEVIGQWELRSARFHFFPTSKRLRPCSRKALSVGYRPLCHTDPLLSIILFRAVMMLWCPEMSALPSGIPWIREVKSISMLFGTKCLLGSKTKEKQTNKHNYNSICPNLTLTSLRNIIYLLILIR